MRTDIRTGGKIVVNNFRAKLLGKKNRVHGTNRCKLTTRNTLKLQQENKLPQKVRYFSV